MGAILVVWSIVSKIVPIVEDVVEALSKDSDGGKKITPRERRRIIMNALPKIGQVLDEALPV
jgi:tRNA G37 N-methylase Trm5